MFWGEQNLMDPQSLNSYSYARSNPIGLSDPSGLITGIPWVDVAIGLLLPNVAYSPAPGEENKVNSELEGKIMIAGFASPSGKASGAVNLLEKEGLQVGKFTGDELVLRGGSIANQTTQKIDDAINSSILRGGEGFSVQCSTNCTKINQLSFLGKYLPNKEVAVTTVNKIRELGGDVIKTPGFGEHATVINLDGLKASSILNEIYKNIKHLIK